MAKRERVSQKVVVRRNVRNQSARTSSIKAVVIHSTESDNRVGTSDLASIGAWFDNPGAQASSHVCTDADGQSARYVPDSRKAWHGGSYNSQTLGIEQIGRAAQSSWSDREIDETARWVAYWSLKHKIPIRVGAVSGGQVTKTGVVTHSMLGSLGGGHHDPGTGYPMDRMLRRARHFAKIRKTWKRPWR